MSRSRRLGASPSKARMSSRACGSTARPLGVERTLFRLPPRPAPLAGPADFVAAGGTELLIGIGRYSWGCRSFARVTDVPDRAFHAITLPHSTRPRHGLPQGQPACERVVVNDNRSAGAYPLEEY